MGKIIGFTHEGDPVFKTQQKNWLKSHRPERRNIKLYAFTLPVSLNITKIKSGGAIVDGVFYHEKDIPEAVRQLKDNET